MQSIGGFANASYGYDANGNVSHDGRNNVNIAYNFLNLPQSISGGQNLTYTYDATGRKLRKVSGNVATDYISGIQYTNGSMDFVQTEEGRATKNGGNWNYEYTLTDHLGNGRVNIDSYAGTARVLQEDEYYPFGLDKQRYTFGTKNKYLYNKKEVQEELNQYDYGARFYDPVIARWGTMDPLAEMGRRWSPYSYTFDDPMRFTDSDGMWPDCTTCDLLIGYAAAVVDNNTGGLLPVRQVAGHLVSDAKAFNLGQDAGDVASIIQGGAEVHGGTGIIGGAAVATVGSGGLAIEVTAPAALGGAALVAHGAVTGVHGATSLASQKGRLKETGSYTNTHESGKTYSGKGGKARSQQSGERVARENNDPHVATDHTPAENDRQAFKDEDTRIENNGGHGNTDQNYNKRASPGKKYKAQDGGQ